MGPCTLPSHCCAVPSPTVHPLPCATFRSPHTAGVFHFFCHRVLADYGPPIAAARPLICHGAPIPRLHHAAAKSRVSHGSLYGLPLLLSPSPHSAMCHFQVSSHTAVCVYIFL
ncbi:unnamed protein product, partial [Staurois parvus]